jgi:LysM repeat protein
MLTREMRRSVGARLQLAAALGGVVSAVACAWLTPEPTAPPPQREESAGPVHRVEPGETLCSVGGRHGLSAPALRTSNGIEIGLAEPLPTGTSLRLEGAPATYTVRWGDTLLAIARWSGTEMDALARHNGMSDPHILFEGQELSIPAGAATVCAPAPKRAPTRIPEAAEVPERSPTVPARPPGQQEILEAAVAPSETGEEEGLLARAEEHYADADYEACLHAAALASEQLALQAGDPPARRLAARAAAIAGLAHAGRQRREEAVAAFRTTFALDPDFELEAHYASPRILPLLREAQEPEVAR